MGTKFTGYKLHLLGVMFCLKFLAAATRPVRSAWLSKARDPLQERPHLGLVYETQPNVRVNQKAKCFRNYESITSSAQARCNQAAQEAKIKHDDILRCSTHE